MTGLYLKEANMKMSIEDMKNAAIQMQQDQYIHDAIEELNSLNETDLLLHNFKVKEFDIMRREHLLVFVTPKEMNQIKEVIRSLGFTINVKFFHPIMLDEAEFITSSKDIQYVGCLEGGSEELWPFMLFFHSKWLEEYLAFDYTLKNRHEIFPDHFLETVDDMLDYSWCQDEFVTPKLKKRVNEITKNIESFKMEGISKQKFGITIIYTPFTMARAKDKNMNAQNMKMYMYHIFRTLKMSSSINNEVQDTNRLVSLIEAVMIGFIACRLNREIITFHKDKIIWFEDIDKIIFLRKAGEQCKKYLNKFFIKREDIKELKDTENSLDLNDFDGDLPEELKELFKDLNLSGNNKIVPIKISSPEDLENFFENLKNISSKFTESNVEDGEDMNQKLPKKPRGRVIQSRGKRKEKGEEDGKGDNND